MHTAKRTVEHYFQRCMKYVENIWEQRNHDFKASINIFRLSANELDGQERPWYLEPEMCEWKRKQLQKESANSESDGIRKRPKL